MGFPAYVEVHETGPIFLLDPHDLPTLAPLLDDVRAIARHWAERPLAGGPNTLRVKIRYGPSADTGSPGGDEYHAWKRVKVTTDPKTFADRLDELVAFVIRVGFS